ncbi:MAG TPA: transposase [Candidatus Angelobacter sp.]|nr:transposase [Candidatus Angelobacter sp.]
MTIPHRGRTSDSTYFVTATVFDKRACSSRENRSPLFWILFNHRNEGRYNLHEFVVMPDHFHLIISPVGVTLERAMQFINGGFSFRFNRDLRIRREVWQGSYFDRRVRDSLEYQKYKDYIWQNPVKKGLAKAPEEYPYSSANPSFGWIRYPSG